MCNCSLLDDLAAEDTDKLTGYSHFNGVERWRACPVCDGLDGAEAVNGCAASHRSLLIWYDGRSMALFAEDCEENRIIDCFSLQKYFNAVSVRLN